MATAPPTLPALAAVVADAAHRDQRKLSLSFILGGGPPTADALRFTPAQPLPSMFRPFKTEPVQSHRYDSHGYGRQPARPLLHHRFAPLAPPPSTGAAHYAPPRPATAASSASAASPSRYVVARRPAAQKKTYEQMTKQEKRKARACRVDGCESYIINRGLCFRHGGGKRCAEPGCDSSAKNQGLCWKHGGSTNCIIDGCTRRGKARGLCWAHGGGTQCATPGCTTIAVSNGKCWAHGGGKRCAFDGCTRAAYERTYNYCMKHHELLRDGRHSVDL